VVRTIKYFVFSALLSCCNATAADGPASIIDGDTLEIEGETIDLYGVDAPEDTQFCKAESGLLWPCGQRAASNLSDYIGKAKVSCRPKQSRGGSPVAVCFKGRQDLGAWLVSNGWAVAYTRDTKDYVETERLARSWRHNLWAGEFTLPWEWRSGVRTAADRITNPWQLGKPPVSGSIPSRRECVIKGNIDIEGKRLYYMPGTSSYASVSINFLQGERLFCTEEEAREAGWRKAHRSDPLNVIPVKRQEP
jgi:endonuclease YncB( thermonuclease family)